MTHPAARLLALLAGALGACASPPAVLNGNRVFAPTTPYEAAAGEPAGELVRWGGRIAATHPGERETCVDVVGQPLDSRARPEWTDATIGRFRACAAGFYDPEVYAEGRLVTAVGVIEGKEHLRVGEYDLDVPVVAAEVLYIWPEEPAVVAYPVYPAWGFGWWGGPWWGGPYWGWRSWYPYRIPGRLPPPAPRKLN